VAEAEAVGGPVMPASHPAGRPAVVMASVMLLGVPVTTRESLWCVDVVGTLVCLPTNVSLVPTVL